MLAYFYSLNFVHKIEKKEEDEPSTSTNPVLELELTEEKLPMTLSRQEVSQYKTSALSFHSFSFKYHNISFAYHQVYKYLICITVFV